jgi:hypothetical protein
MEPQRAQALALYRRETNSEAVFRRAKILGIGFTVGGTVGVAATFLRTQRLGKQGLGAGAFMGTIMGVGGLVRGWNMH